MIHTLQLSQSQAMSFSEVKGAFTFLADFIRDISEHLVSLDKGLNEIADNRIIVMKAIKIASVATEQINASIDEQKSAVTSIMNASMELHTDAERMHDLVERFT